MSKLQRYTWEDAIHKARAVGEINNGVTNLALKMSFAITWRPKDGGPPELSWSDKGFCAAVRISRTVFYEWVDEMESKGFIYKRGRNYFPRLPDNISSIEEAYEVRVEATKLKYENDKHTPSECSESEHGVFTIRT